MIKKRISAVLAICIVFVLTGLLLPVSSSIIISNAQPVGNTNANGLLSEVIEILCEILPPALPITETPETMEITIIEEEVPDSKGSQPSSRTVNADVWTLQKITDSNGTVLTRAMQGFAIDKRNGSIYAFANPADPDTGTNMPGNNYIYKIETENGELKRMKTLNYQLNTEHSNGAAILNGELFIAGGKPNLTEYNGTTALYKCKVSGHGFQIICLPWTTDNGKAWYYSAIASDNTGSGQLYALLRNEAFVEMDTDGSIRNTFRIKKNQRPNENGIQDCGYNNNALYLVTYDSIADSPTYNCNYVYRYLIDKNTGTCTLDKKYRIDAKDLSLWENSGKVEFEGIDFLTVDDITYAYLIECGDYAREDPENSRFSVVRFRID